MRPLAPYVAFGESVSLQRQSVVSFHCSGDNVNAYLFMGLVSTKFLSLRA